MFKPKLVETLKNYRKDQFVKDLIAGVIVGIVALPLAIAFAIASGVSPEKGLYTAIIAGFLARRAKTAWSWLKIVAVYIGVMLLLAFFFLIGKLPPRT